MQNLVKLSFEDILLQASNERKQIAKSVLAWFLMETPKNNLDYLYESFKSIDNNEKLNLELFLLSLTPDLTLEFPESDGSATLNVNADQLNITLKYSEFKGELDEQHHFSTLEAMLLFLEDFEI